MRALRFGLLIMLLGAGKNAAAQVPGADERAAPAAEPAQEPPAPEPGAPAPPPESAPDPVAAPESAPAPAKIPEGAPEPKAEPPPKPSSRAPAVAATDEQEEVPALPPWIRAHRPLTIEARLGLLVRPESSEGFDDETHLGADFGLSGYLDLSREVAAGLELEHASLGRGSAVSGLDTVSTDFSVTSAMLGVRAYPKRSDMLDLYVGLQLGVGFQHVSSAGTRVNEPLRPGAPFSCSGSDSPGFQIGGGVGARFMISPSWGIGARVNATGRRLTSDVIDACAQGIGGATTITAGLGLGYDFDLDP
ncbi:MAG: hypothetical protein EOO73_24215 [Myxococcales bacterium]|nr:MAG: hypothetical protein EOO73_24215 [Myxococcales bacterium]